MKKSQDRTPPIVAYWLIRSASGQYLYYNKSLFKSGYYFKDSNNGAVILDTKKTKKVLTYLHDNGIYGCYKKKVRK